MQVATLAAAFVGYVVFWNLSLQVNSVGFYQLSKIMVLPTVAALEVSATACSQHLHQVEHPCPPAHAYTVLCMGHMRL